MVVFVNMAFRGQRSDTPIMIRVGHLWKMRDGKVLGLKIFPEREKALEAVGLSEQDAHTES